MSQAELSPEQVAELKQAFEMFDRDQGGSINTKELVNANNFQDGNKETPNNGSI